MTLDGLDPRLITVGAVGDLGADEELWVDGDPVVRMPRVMAQKPSTRSTATSPRNVALVALVGALVGASLGGVGLAIVWALGHSSTTAVFGARAAAVDAASVHRAQATQATQATLGVADRARAVADGGVRELYALSAVTTVEAQPAEGAVTTAESGEPGLERPNVQRMVLGTGRTLATVLRAMAMPAREVTGVIRALGHWVNLRSLRPSDGVTVFREPGSAVVQRVELRHGVFSTFVVSAVEGGRWHVEKSTLSVGSSRVEVGFRIRRSVEESVRAAGLDRSIVAAIVECFSAIDLPLTVADGDTLKLVVDEERIDREFSRYGPLLAMDYRGIHGERRAFWVRVGRGRGQWFDADGMGPNRGPLRAPVVGISIVAGFNPERVHPRTGRRTPHNGVDYAAPEGTAVYAAADGVVTWANEAGTSGNLVRVRHEALGLVTGYAHLSSIAEGVRPGQRVSARQRLGEIGSTGRSFGAHLHFSVLRSGAFVDPVEFFGERRAVAIALRRRFELERDALGAVLDRVRVGAALEAVPTAGAANTTEGLGAANGANTPQGGDDFLHREGPTPEAEGGWDEDDSTGVPAD